MIKLKGFTVTEEIYNSYNSVILKAKRNSDEMPVIIKLLNKDYPAEQELSLFRREYEITKKLRGPNIIELYELLSHKNTLAIVMEDFQGISLHEALETIEITFSEKLDLALQMAAAVAQIHEKNVIHKDINPSNVIWNRISGKLKVIDFGISTELQREKTHYNNLDILEGTLDYISPEQTGRMNRPVDYRSDLYSLGASLYEIFTGKRPYQWNDEAEIIYCHIAKEPLDPRELSPELPPALSKIILKLLSKVVEERYQMALGLKYDLEYCKEQYSKQGKIADFIIGQKDISDRFQIPQEVYGREEEIGFLENLFTQVTSGDSSVLIVDGHPGVGKSTLIHEILKSIAIKKGYFISGKFDGLEKNIPYFAIIQAIEGLINQILLETDEKLALWKKNILDALSQNAQVIIDLIPALEQIIGPQPPVIELTPLESQNRFLISFREFIKVFAQKEHPLVIFLDDLQWCDLSTLELLNYLVKSTEVKYLLYIGAFRDNEIYKDHPIVHWLEGLKERTDKSRNKLNHLVIGPLEKAAVNQLLADTFHCESHETKALSDLVYQKCEGNPFFTNQLLYSLYKMGVFKFNGIKGKWEWDLEEVDQFKISDNVADLLVHSLQSLPKETLTLLMYAAAIGNQFSLKSLIMVNDEMEEETGKLLWLAVESEIIYPLDKQYRLMKSNRKYKLSASVNINFAFQHDKIQQAVYSLIPEKDKPRFHLKIGIQFLKEYKCNQKSGNIFNLVNHLNKGKELIDQNTEKIELANLNFLAGRKAKKATAFSSAVSYFETGINLLSEEDWDYVPDEKFKLYLEYADSLFLSGNLMGTEILCGFLFKLSSNKFDTAMVHDLKTRVLEFQGRFYNAIDEIRKSLLLINIILPQDPQEIKLKTEEGINIMIKGLGNNPRKVLDNLPIMTDKEKMLAIQLLYQLVPSARQYDPPLYTLATLMMLELTLKFGTTAYSSKCYVDCGVILCSRIQNHRTAYKLGEAAFGLITRHRAEFIKPAVNFVFPFISYWNTHYSEALEYYEIAYKYGLETGDIQHAAYSRSHKLHLSMYVGKNLSEIKSQIDQAMHFLTDFQVAMPIQLARTIIFFIDKFQSKPIKGKNDEAQFKEADEDLIETLKKIKNIVYLGRFYQYNTFFHVIHGLFSEAEKWNTLADEIIEAAHADFPLADHYFYQSLILLKKIKKVDQKQKQIIMEKLQNNLCRFNEWAQNCPENFKHKYYFIKAELAVIQDESLEKIINLYQEAMNSFENNDYLHIRGLLNESQADFWLNRGNEIIGKSFIREAYYNYLQWGAYRKTYLLEQHYPQVLHTQHSAINNVKLSRDGLAASKTLSTDIIDLSSIVKSSQAISSEIKFDKLLRTLMYIIIENAGAQQGCLLLKNYSDDDFYIEAIKKSGSDHIEVMQSQPYKQSTSICHEIIQYIIRTKKSVVLDDASKQGDFMNSAYIRNHRIKSLLSMPVVYQNSLKAIVYLENNLTDSVFTAHRTHILKILSSQAAISIDNAKLYKSLEEKVKERTLQLKNANKKLKELSLLDPLTTLHNRRYIYEFIAGLSLNFIKSKSKTLHNKEKRDLNTDKKVLGFFLIDLDHFKKVNDTYGHAAGDKVLIKISGTLKNLIRKEDFIVRWGGEEFLIILNNTKADYMEIFPQKVINAIQSTAIHISENKILHKTCSIGAAMMPFDPQNPELLSLEQTINISDYALYLAKEHGRNRAVIIYLNQDFSGNELIKKYLINLSKDTAINSNYLRIKYISGDQPHLE
ncbi:MAG: AAA family ATPase [Spirochaetales bacterium]|nr:AAA family ATPase [Spirochaetales bacterium]